MLMRHAAEKRRNSPRAGGGHGTAAAIGGRKTDAAGDIFRAASSELPVVLRWPIGFAHWHVVAKYRAGLAGLETHAVTMDAGDGDGGRHGADAFVFDLGRLDSGSTFEARHRA